MVGSGVILSLGRRKRSEAIFVPGLFLRGTSLIWYALMTSYAWAVPAAFLAGFGDTWISVALFSLLMERTKQGMFGRVTAFQATASALTTFLALVMFGTLKRSVFHCQFLLFCGLALCRVGMSTTL